MSKLLKEVFDRNGKEFQMKPILATKEDIEKRNNQIKIPRLDAMAEEDDRREENDREFEAARVGNIENQNKPKDTNPGIDMPVTTYNISGNTKKDAKKFARDGYESNLKEETLLELSKKILRGK